jgi:NADPH:quinone reductase-like Zn-dependent oxidoreductase
MAAWDGDAGRSSSLASAADLGAAGAYTPRVQATYPLDEAAHAHAHVQDGHTQGKVIITF